MSARVDSNLKVKGKNRAWNVYDIDDSGRKSRRPVSLNQSKAKGSQRAEREEIALSAKETIGRMYEKFGDDLKRLQEVFEQHLVSPVAQALQVPGVPERTINRIQRHVQGGE